MRRSIPFSSFSSSSSRAGYMRHAHNQGKEKRALTMKATGLPKETSEMIGRMSSSITTLMDVEMPARQAGSIDRVRGVW